MFAQKQRAPAPCRECTVTPTTTPHTLCASPACSGCRQTKLWIGWVCENAADIFQCPRCLNTPPNMAGLILQHTLCATTLGRGLSVDEEMGLSLWLQGFSNDVRWMLRVEYTRLCEGKIITMELEKDQEGEEWAMWMLDEHWLTKKIAGDEFEEMLEYLPEED